MMMRQFAGLKQNHQIGTAREGSPHAGFARERR
jgi:hypothetical protein